MSDDILMKYLNCIMGIIKWFVLQTILIFLLPSIWGGCLCIEFFAFVLLYTTLYSIFAEFVPRKHRVNWVLLPYSLYAIVVIMASLVEKEAKLATERATISGVIYNRLKNKANFPYLQIDATVLYALNKTDALTEEDLKVESPYNTYVTEGLPPTAICSPGVSCLLAAILPEEHRYYYYVVDINSEIKGQHIFSKTLAEHNNAIANMKK